MLVDGMRSPDAVPRDVADLDVSWVGAALTGVSGGAKLVEVTAEKIGKGMVAESLRLRLVWDRPTEAPTSVVAKVPSSQAQSREAAAATRTYLLEAAFYNELASTVDVRCPGCFFARYDPDTGDYVVLLEDAAPAEAGDQLMGCTVEQAAAALPELAALHASHWGGRSLEGFDWLERPTLEGATFTADLLGGLWPGFVERYGDRVDPEVLALTRRLVPHLASVLADAPRPWTLVHGDFRLDNLLFGGPRVVVVDWQTVRIGPGIDDTAYFLGAGLSTADRRRAETDLVREYHGMLVSRSIDYGWDECWSGYRSGGLGGLLMGFAAAMLVAPTPRGDEMFLAMVNRHGAQLLDLEAESLLTG